MVHTKKFIYLNVGEIGGYYLHCGEINCEI